MAADEQQDASSGSEGGDSSGSDGLDQQTAEVVGAGVQAAPELVDAFTPGNRVGPGSGGGSGGGQRRPVGRPRQPAHGGQTGGRQSAPSRGAGGGPGKPEVEQASNDGSGGVCGPEQVALEIEMGLRDKSGAVTRKGQTEGVPTDCSSQVLRQGVQMYQQRSPNAGGSAGAQSGGGRAAPPPAPGGNVQPAAGGAGGRASQAQPPSPPTATSANMGGVAAELPANLDTSLPGQWTGYAVKLAKYLVGTLGESGANQVLATLAGALGRRLNPETKSPMCFEELADTLPPEWQSAIRLWQCGADGPMGLRSEGEDLFFALELATSGYDLKSQTTTKCCRGC